MRVNSSREYPPGKPRTFDTGWVPGGGHLVVNTVPASRAFVNNEKLASQFFIVISDGAQKSRVILNIRRGFFDHKRAINTMKLFALSLFGRSDSFRDLFYAVLLS